MKKLTNQATAYEILLSFLLKGFSLNEEDHVSSNFFISHEYIFWPDCEMAKASVIDPFEWTEFYGI